jgi:membrane protein implicated in regulation of membrane protease activity
MKKLIVNILAMCLLILEVNNPGGPLTWIGGGIILISVIDFFKKVYNEQEDN